MASFDFISIKNFIHEFKNFIVLKIDFVIKYEKSDTAISQNFLIKHECNKRMLKIFKYLKNFSTLKSYLLFLLFIILYFYYKLIT